MPTLRIDHEFEDEELVKLLKFVEKTLKRDADIREQFSGNDLRETEEVATMRWIAKNLGRVRRDYYTAKGAR